MKLLVLKEKNIMTGETFIFRDEKFLVTRLLGRGKSGYAYLIENTERQYVLKKIHHEPCFYYNFKDKMGQELESYIRLSKTGINLPKLYHYDESEEYIIKEYIHGRNLAQVIAEGSIEEQHLSELFRISKVLKKECINIDYFPTNFVLEGEDIYYIDYEFNPYTDEWSFENWGIYYYANPQGMKKFLENGDHEAINQSDSGIPHKEGFEELVGNWMKKFGRH